MITINTIDGKYFELDGIRYAKIYQPLAQGSSAIGIYSIYDTGLQLQNSIDYTEISINGVVYTTQADTIKNMLAVIWSSISEIEFDEYKNKVTNLEANQTTGVAVYSTYAELPATGTLLVSYKVSNDPIPSNNGFYHWTGSAYLKDAELTSYLEAKNLFTDESLSSNELKVINKAIKNLRLKLAEGYSLLAGQYIRLYWVNKSTSQVIVRVVNSDESIYRQINLNTAQGGAGVEYLSGNIVDEFFVEMIIDWNEVPSGFIDFANKVYINYEVQLYGVQIQKEIALPEIFMSKGFLPNSTLSDYSKLDVLVNAVSRLKVTLKSAVILPNGEYLSLNYTRKSDGLFQIRHYNSNGTTLRNNQWYYSPSGRTVINEENEYMYVEAEINWNNIPSGFDVFGADLRINYLYNTEGKTLFDNRINDLFGDVSEFIEKTEKKEIPMGNDWYDPNFTRQYFHDTQANFKTQEGVDFAFISGIDVVSLISPDGYNSARTTSGGTNLFTLTPAWTKYYFDSLGYLDGEKIKFGCWVKLPDASVGSTRLVYIGGDTYEETPKTIDNSDWNWVETTDDIIVDAAIWQNVYLGFRNMPANEEVYFRGLTLVNIDRQEWIGERRSERFEQAISKDFVNLNGYVEKIFDNTPLLAGGSEQTGRQFTKTKILVDQYGVEGVRFTCGDAGVLFRMNISAAIIALNDIDKFNLPLYEGFFKYGFWLRATTELNTTGMTVYHGEGIKVVTSPYFFRNLKHGVWYWVELPALKLDEGIKDIFTNCQINGTPLNVGEFMEYEVCGLTVSFLDDPLSFKFQPRSIAKGLRFYGLNYASYGDSITAANGYQKMINNRFAMNHYMRGIGGTTMVKNSSIAWVDVDGNYIDRPPSPPPSGIEGVDYFEIESAMCSQDRVDTIPLDTDVVTIMAGTNDYAQNAVIGTRNDSPSDLFGGTFYAAWKSCFGKLQARLPNAMIFVLNITYKQNENTTPNENGEYLYQFRRAVCEVAEMYSVPVFETNVFGINDFNWSNYSIDGVHPNNIANALIGSRISDDLKKYDYSDSAKGI